MFCEYTYKIILRRPADGQLRTIFVSVRSVHDLTNVREDVVLWAAEKAIEGEIAQRAREGEQQRCRKLVRVINLELEVAHATS